MKLSPNQPCPCGRGPKFKRCCRALHRGAPAATPEDLMRSRYAAYAAGEAGYIVDTTDPRGPQFQPDRARWLAEVTAFSRGTRFLGLEVRDSRVEGERGWVSFWVTLRQGERDVSFGERSLFRRVGERWLYHSGTPLEA